MKEIIYDLLCVGKSHKTFAINPEVKLRDKTSGSGVFGELVSSLSSMSYLSLSPSVALSEDEYRFASFLGDC